MFQFRIFNSKKFINISLIADYCRMEYEENKTTAITYSDSGMKVITYYV